MNAVLVIGAGRTGQACAEVLAARGQRVYVTDEELPKNLRDPISAIEHAGAEFIPPENVRAMLPKIERAILSPGVPLSGALAQDVAACLPLVSEIEIAYELCAAPIIAITGTKGKSTTTALVAHILRCAGKSVRVGGNIGNPLIREARDAAPGDLVVAEVSSFQLETIQKFKPKVSVLLNVSGDHLDRYPSLDAYARAKYRIFENQDARDIFIGNLDDALVSVAAGSIKAQQFWFTTKEEANASAFAREDVIWHRRDTSAPPRRVLERSDISLPGTHNLENVLAAVLVAFSVGVDAKTLAESIPAFEPMEHRLETVAEIDGVRYVDDSKATNPAAVVAALQAYDSPVVLIAGGKSKGSDFSELGEAIEARVKRLILIGESAEDIKRASGGTRATHASTIEHAVEIARRSAIAGDVVLLSPACASFDMFRSAEERGERFAAAVRELERSAMRETAGA